MPASGGGEAPEELDEKQCLEPIQQHNFKDLSSSCFFSASDYLVVHKA
jgi:hypothetical protein